MRAMLLALPLIASLGGCTSEQVYNSIEASHRTTCLDDASAADELQKCLDDTQKPYDQYKKEAGIH